MKKIVAIILILVGSLGFSNSFAAAITCPGKITATLTWEGGPCTSTNSQGYLVSHLGFKHTGITSGKWVCSNSDLMDAVLLTAKANDAPIDVVMPSTCSPAAHYTRPHYVITD